MRFYTYVGVLINNRNILLVFNVIRNVNSLQSFMLLSFLFPCLHTRWVPLNRWSTFFRSPFLTSWSERIQWFLFRIIHIHVSQVLLISLKELVFLLSLEGQVLLKLSLELIHSSSSGIYHSRLRLMLLYVNMLLHHRQLWNLRCLYFSLFEQLVIG